MSESEQGVRIASAKEWFERQERRMAEGVEHIEHVLGQPETGNAYRLWDALDNVLTHAHKLHAAVLCRRVRTLEAESTRDFANAFMTVYDDAKERLVKNDYRDRTTCSAARFMAGEQREGDAYFVEHFIMVMLELTRDGVTE